MAKENDFSKLDKLADNSEFAKFMNGLGAAEDAKLGDGKKVRGRKGSKKAAGDPIDQAIDADAAQHRAAEAQKRFSVTLFGREDVLFHSNHFIGDRVRALLMVGQQPIIHDNETGRDFAPVLVVAIPS